MVGAAAYLATVRGVNYLFNGQEEGDYLLGKESSMKQVSMTKNIYSCMNHGVCLPIESSIKICL